MGFRELLLAEALHINPFIGIALIPAVVAVATAHLKHHHKLHSSEQVHLAVDVQHSPRICQTQLQTLQGFNL